jgi:hypothetical protein
MYDIIIYGPYMPMLRISFEASVILTLYRATGTAVRFSGISEFLRQIFSFVERS